MKKLLIFALLFCAQFALTENDRSEHRLRNRSGIVGQVVLIACPVAVPDLCPPRSYGGGFSIYNEKGKLVEEVEPEDDGFFVVHLKPGKYTVVPEAPRPPHIWPF